MPAPLQQELLYEGQLADCLPQSCCLPPLPACTCCRQPSAWLHAKGRLAKSLPPCHHCLPKPAAGDPLRSCMPAPLRQKLLLGGALLAALLGGVFWAQKMSEMRAR